MGFTGSQRLKERILRAKQRVTIPRVLATFELYTEPTGGGRITCPFHADENPSAKLYDDDTYFYCFACHAKGDVVGVAQRIIKSPVIPALEMLEVRFRLDKYSLPVVEKNDTPLYWVFKNRCEEAVLRYGKLILGILPLHRQNDFHVVIDDVWREHAILPGAFKKDERPNGKHFGALKSWVQHAKYTYEGWENRKLTEKF